MKCPYIDDLNCDRCDGDRKACDSCVALFPDMYEDD